MITQTILHTGIIARVSVSRGYCYTSGQNVPSQLILHSLMHTATTSPHAPQSMHESRFSMHESRFSMVEHISPGQVVPSRSDPGSHVGCIGFLRQHVVSSIEAISITAKELVPIVIAAFWGSQWTKSRVHFFCDNMALLKTLGRIIMHLLRCLAFYSALWFRDSPIYTT